MNRPLIAVLGAGGAVGSAAAAILAEEGGIRLRCGHRRAPRRADDHRESMPVDGTDAGALARFCTGCRVVVNCAGPSCLIGDRVARAAAAAGADYVDAFGAAPLERQLARWAPDHSRVFVTGAGVFPGLSGILPRWLAASAFDRVEWLRAFAGGREPCSPAGGADVLLSALDGFGIPGAAWVGGGTRTGALSVLDHAEIPGFPGRVHAQPFLSGETERLARALGLERAEWYTVTPSEAVPRAIAAACVRLSNGGAAVPGILDSAVAELMRIGELELAGRAPFYALTLEMAGTHGGERRHRRVVLRAADSYRLSGLVAALAARHLLAGGLPSGVHEAAAVLDPEMVVASLRADGAALLQVIEAEDPVEEGVL